MVFDNSVLNQQNFQLLLQPEEELQFAKSFMDRAAVAVFWVDAEARFLYVNDGACGLAGYSREELLSMTMYDVDPNFCRTVWSEYWRTIKQQGSLTFESLHRTKDGWSFPVEFTVTYLEYHGREYGCIFVRNITQRKQLEVVLDRANEVLERRVAERTAPLRHANEELYREIAECKQIESALRESEARFRTLADKHKQAEVEIRQALEQEQELSEVRSHFISIISHEFRTSLNNISFSTSSLRRYGHQWPEEKKLEYLSSIETDIEQLSSLLDEAPSIGGAEIEKRKFEPKPLNVAQFCRDLVAEMQRRDSNQHTFSFVSQGDCGTAWVDKKLLRSILTNLLSNAIKYSPPNSKVDLELSCWDGKLIFEIKDWGIGIPEVDRQQLFEPFHRGENVGDIQGTGLGLTIVKKFVDLHSGQISVVSEVGVGTTFTVTLPLNKVLKME